MIKKINIVKYFQPTLLILILVLLCISKPAFSLERFDIITTQELKSMLSDRDLGKIDFLLVNGLDQIVFRDSSIPGSINIPWSDIEGNAWKLGHDKNKLIVTY